jgi:hypothetical protein
MRALLRLLAGFFLLVAVIAAVNDATRSMAADRYLPTSALQHWSSLSPPTLAAARRSVERYTHPLVWEYGLRKALELPAWGLLGAIGLVLAYAGRRRRRVNVFAN